jgi:hypothetical protein
MAYSYNVYTGNGSTTQFTIGFPYIRREHVKVYVAYVDTAYTYVNNTTVQLATAPTAGQRVEVRRVTPVASVLVDFADGSTLVAADLDTSNLQHLYIEQELDDYSKQTISIDPATGLLTAGSQRITNVINPINPQDAATKSYVDGVALAGTVPDGDRGDITVSGTGTTWTIDNNTITEAKLAANAVTTGKIQDGTIVDADISPTAGVTSGKLSFTQAGVGTTARTVSSKLQDVVSVKDFGAVCDGTTNDAAAVSAANTAAAGRPLLFPGVTHIGSAVTITCPIVDTMQQIFSITSQVTINNKMPVRPDWWGDVENTLNYATNALPAGGGTVKLANRTYKSNNHAYTFGTANTVNCFSKDNVLYDGEKMPRLADDCRSLVGGTIIQDLVLGYANNIEFRNLGVDAGKTYCDIRYGGPPSIGYGEGLLLTYPDQIKKDAADLRRNARLHNIIGLSYSPTALTHAIIVGEGYQNVTCTGEIVGCYGVHGIVIKCGNVKAEQFTSYCNAFEGVIIKSDAQSTAISYQVQIGKIYVDATGPDGWSPYATASTGNGLYLHCAANNIDGIQIGSLISTGYPIGITSAFGGAYVLANVQIDTARIDCSNIAGSAGVSLQASGGQLIQYCQFGNLYIRNCAIGIVAQYVGNGSLTSFSNVDAVNVSDVVLQIGNTACINISAIHARTVTNAVARITGTPKLLFGQVFRDQAGCPMFHSGSGGLVPTLKNGWTQFASNDTFRVELEGGRIHMRGLIAPGTSITLSTLPQWAWPAETKRFVVLGYTVGVGQVAVPIVIGVNGDVSVNEVAGGTANCTNYLSLAGCSWTGQA